MLDLFLANKPYSVEHSLYSMSKWEAKFEKPFLSTVEKSDDELMYYMQCIVMRGDPEEFVLNLAPETVDEINAYMVKAHTATKFYSLRKGGEAPSKEIITTELIYYWMVGMEIPFETQYWPWNRLWSLIRIHSLKTNPKGEKMAEKDRQQYYRELNAKRRAELNTKG